MGELGVNRTPNNFSVQGFESRGLVGKGNDFRGANKGKVQGVKEEDEVLALVRIEGDGPELTVGKEGVSREARCRFLNSGNCLHI